VSAVETTLDPGSETTLLLSFRMPPHGSYIYYLQAYNKSTGTVDDEVVIQVNSCEFTIDIANLYTQTGPHSFVSADPPPDHQEIYACSDAQELTQVLYYINLPQQIKFTVYSDMEFLYARVQNTKGTVYYCVRDNPFVLTSNQLRGVNKGIMFIYLHTATITVNIKQAVGGTTDPAPGTYYIKRGTSIKWGCDANEINPCRDVMVIRAVPDSGYEFKYFLVNNQQVYSNPLVLDPPCQNTTLDVTPVFEPTASTLSPTPTPTPTPSPVSTASIDTSSQLVLTSLALLAFASLMKKPKQRF
jgi:hypothetical protein